MLHQCKIRVLKTTVQEDYLRLLPPQEQAPCPVFHEGQEWTLWHYGRPLDFCEEAWTAINRTVYAIQSGTGGRMGGCWIEEGVRAVLCCSDGRRPVFFELSRVD